MGHSLAGRCSWPKKAIRATEARAAGCQSFELQRPQLSPGEELQTASCGGSVTGRRTSERAACVQPVDHGETHWGWGWARAPEHQKTPAPEPGRGQEEGGGGGRGRATQSPRVPLRPSPAQQVTSYAPAGWCSSYPSHKQKEGSCESSVKI